MKQNKKLAVLLSRVFALAAMLMPVGAHATPPDVITVQEEPFAVSDTHFFVIRSSTDNLGLYESERSESYLVAIAPDGSEDRYWLLDRVTRSSQYSPESEFLGYQTVRDPGIDGQRANPYIVADSFQALPWRALSRISSDGDKPQFAARNGWVTARLPNGESYRVRQADLQAKARKVGGFMARNVADHRRLATTGTRTLFAELAANPGQCSPVRVHEYFLLGKGRAAPLLEAYCTSGEEDGGIAVLVPMVATSR